MIAVLEKPVYILAAKRTPIGRFDGALAEFSAPELGGRAAAAALEAARVAPGAVELLTEGCVVASGLGMAPAKRAALAAGLPPEVATRTVESVCASSLEAVASTADALVLGRVRLAVAGGMESRTNAPYYLEPCAKGERLPLKKAGAYRFKFDAGAGEAAAAAGFIDATAYDGLFWPVEKKFMRDYALAFAKRNGIRLEDVNAAAEESHSKARAAWRDGRFRDEVVAVGGADRDDLIPDAELAEQREIAKKDISTAFNTSAPADCGAAAVLCSEDGLRLAGAPPMARILGYARVDGPAAEFVDSPVRALNALFAALGPKGYPEALFECLELNEAFGIQLPVFALAFPGRAINVNGGAIALGHPLGAAGVRLLTTLVHVLRGTGRRYGAVGLCFGGGGSYALAVETV